MDPYAVYALVATVIVAIGSVVLILLFERQRARQIEHDLHEEGEQDRRPGREDGS